MNKKTTGIIAYITWIGWIVAFCAGDKEGAKFSAEVLSYEGHVERQPHVSLSKRRLAENYRRQTSFRTFGVV